MTELGPLRLLTTKMGEVHVAPECVAVDLYRGRVAVREVLLFADGPCVTRDSRWIWATVRHGWCTLALTGHPNRHLIVCPIEDALSGAWRLAESGKGVDEMTPGLTPVVLLSHEQAKRVDIVRYGRVAQLSTKIDQHGFLPWWVGGDLDDLDLICGPAPGPRGRRPCRSMMRLRPVPGGVAPML